MARRKDNPWLPSGGVLVVAVIAAVLAAILLNVYVGYLKTSYEAGSVMFLQIKRDVAKGETIESSHITGFRVPKPLLSSFSKVIVAKDADSLVVGQKVRRDMLAGEFIQYMDFQPGMAKVMAKIRPGYGRMSIDIRPEPLLQPGAFITIMGAFDINPEDRKEDRRIMDVLYNIQVKAVGGSSEATEVKRRADNNITVELKQTQIRQLLQIKESLVDKHFIVSLSPSPTGSAGEPKFSDEILDYIAQLNRVVPPATP